MAQGTVITNNLNLAQGETSAVERKALFVFPTNSASGLAGSFSIVNAQSDLEEVLSGSEYAIPVMLAAQLNGGENWEAAVMYHSMGAEGPVELEQLVDSVLDVYPAEFVCHVWSPRTAFDTDIKPHIERWQAFAELQRTSKARRIIVLLEMPGDPWVSQGGGDDKETWDDYLTRMNAAQDGVAAYRVALVPALHQNDLGALAGRLCNAS